MCPVCRKVHQLHAAQNNKRGPSPSGESHRHGEGRRGIAGSEGRTDSDARCGKVKAAGVSPPYPAVPAPTRGRLCLPPPPRPPQAVWGREEMINVIYLTMLSHI